MKITTLVDNTRLEGRQDLAVERGLSLHIETESLNILFDMGGRRYVLSKCASTRC